MKTQFITDDSGNKVAVIVPVKEYKKMIDDLEEFASIKAYDKAKASQRGFVAARDMFDAIESKRKN